MNYLKTIFVVLLAVVLFASCTEKVDPLQKSVVEELTDEEIAEVQKTIPEFAKQYHFIHHMAILSELMDDPSLNEVSYQRMMDFLQYKPDTATLFPRCRQEWNIKYAEMDTLDTAYVPLWKYKNDAITAELSAHDSLCCEIFTRAAAHVRFVGGK